MTKTNQTRLLFIIIMVSLFANSYAQKSMRIHYHNGTHTDIPIAEIDSLTFIDSEAAQPVDAEATLTGSWLWGSREAGYYELLTLNTDHTYIGYDNYFTYGFDTQTYGWYSHYGAMLTLWSNGFGYQRRYNWFVTALTDNALEVMTQTGPFTYYRLQPEVLRLQVGSTLSCGADESFVFADGVIAAIVDNTLRAQSPGITYILKKVSPSGNILAYQVVVE